MNTDIFVTELPITGKLGGVRRISGTDASYRLTQIDYEGDKFTFTMWIRADETSMITISYGSVQHTFDITDEWKRLEYKFDTDTTSSIELTFLTDTTYYLYEAQLERGAIVTDWKPAPEDVDAQDVEDIRQRANEAYELAETANTNVTNVVNKTKTIQFSEELGLKLSSKEDARSYVLVDDDSVDVYTDNNKIATFGHTVEEYSGDGWSSTNDFSYVKLGRPTTTNGVTHYNMEISSGVETPSEGDVFEYGLINTTNGLNVNSDKYISLSADGDIELITTDGEVRINGSIIRLNGSGGIKLTEVSNNFTIDNNGTVYNICNILAKANKLASTGVKAWTQIATRSGTSASGTHTLTTALTNYSELMIAVGINSTGDTQRKLATTIIPMNVFRDSTKDYGGGFHQAMYYNGESSHWSGGLTYISDTSIKTYASGTSSAYVRIFAR